MVKYKVENLNDLEVLVDKLCSLLVKSDLSINEIKEKSRLITYFSNTSEFSIKLSELIDLYQKDKKKAYYYALEKLKYRDDLKKKLVEEFKSKYGIENTLEENSDRNNETDDKFINLSDVVNDVDKEVSKTSLIKLNNEDDIKEIESIVSLNEEERLFIRKNTIETNYFLQVKFRNDATTELKFNKDVYTLTINPKSLIIFHEDFIDKYQYDIEIDKEYFKEKNQYITEFNSDFVKKILEQGYRNILFIKQGKKLFRFVELSLKESLLLSNNDDVSYKITGSENIYAKFINGVRIYILALQEKMQIEIEDFILSKDKILISSVDIEDKEEFEEVIKNSFFQEVERFKELSTETTSKDIITDNSIVVNDATKLQEATETKENDSDVNVMSFDIAKLKSMFGKRNKRS